MSTTPTVEVFYRPGCPFCASLKVSLAARGVPATWTNIWEDDKARNTVRLANNGDETVPTVRIGDWTRTNPSGRKVAAQLKKAGGDSGGSRSWLARLTGR